MPPQAASNGSSPRGRSPISPSHSTWTSSCGRSTTSSSGKRNRSMTGRAHESARILVVDDQDANVLLLRRILESGGYREVVGLTDPREAGKTFDEFAPDLVMLDLHMPYLGGVEVLELLTS